MNVFKEKSKQTTLWYEGGRKLMSLKDVTLASNKIHPFKFINSSPSAKIYSIFINPGK